MIKIIIAAVFVTMVIVHAVIEKMHYNERKNMYDRLMCKDFREYSIYTEQKKDTFTKPRLKELEDDWNKQE